MTSLGQKRKFIEGFHVMTKIGDGIFRFTSTWKVRIVMPGSFGGQLISQALMAAANTVLPGMNIHSVHCYFLRPGNIDAPIDYHVCNTRDGSSFCYRTVTAFQNGKSIIELQTSFHKEAVEPPTMFNYQSLMPSVKHHSELQSLEEIVRTKTKYLDAATEIILKSLANELPIEIKPVDGVFTRDVPSCDRRQAIWVRVIGDIGTSQNMHRCVLAFASDTRVLDCVMTSHLHAKYTFVASLEHSIWIHRSPKMTEWILLEVHSPCMTNGRAMVHGWFWSDNGNLIATVTQQALIRGKI